MHRAVTAGTPLNGPPGSIADRAYTPETLERIHAEIAGRDRLPISVPITALHSRNDQIVEWQTCVDERDPHVENIEISSTRVGMGIDPDVWQLVSERLAT